VFPSAGFDRWYWNDAVLKKAGLDAEKFPPFVSPGDEIGTLLPAVAAQFGFSRKVTVLAGGPDFFVSILGTGTVRPGQGCDRSGTSEGINACTAARITDSRMMSYGHPIQPYWNCSGIISTSGKAIAWGQELLGITGHEEFYALAAAAPPGAGGLLFLPYLAGERAPIWDPNARGVFMGLSLSTRREEIARAIAEGVCFAIRDVVTVMEEAGAPVEELRVTGGPAESTFLNQLKADISRRPVLLPGGGTSRDEGELRDKLPAELLGLGVIGATAMGKYPSFGEAAATFVGIEKTFTPKADTASVYEDRFGSYRSLYQCLKSHFERVAAP
jgi:xylulokinase